MKRFAFSNFLIPIVLLMLVSCVRHDEMEFRGKVIDVRQCALSYLDQNPGYMVQLEYPEGVGGTINDEENTADNIVVLYEPDRHIMVGDIVYGSFYLDPKYSKANCSVHWDYDLPEGVFTKVRTDN